MKPSLSIIIITKNAAETLEKCLMSVSFADEIIVIDHESTDNTVEIARKYTPYVFQMDWQGFGIQKNRALEKATGDWVFSIDSDEWIDDLLREEIVTTIKSTSDNVFDLPRRNQYCGQWMRFGDVGHDRVIRLFKRGEALFSKDVVHERIISTHTIKKLNTALMHRAYPNISTLLQRMDKYSTLSAELRFSQGKKTSFLKAIFSGVFSFLKAYVFRLGFLDGKMGFIVAATSAQGSFYRHIKLLEKWQS